MTTRRIIAAIAALLIALVGSAAVVTYARAADRRALAGQEAVRVYVAQKEIPAGTTAGKAVADHLMTTELIARKAVPDDALTSVTGGYDQLVATSTVQPGELVIKGRFAARGAAEGGLAVPAGMFAVSVALDDPSHVGPFVTVGTKVAVFDTFNVAETDRKNLTPAGDHLQDRHEFTRATRLLLPNVEVLAIDGTTTPAKPAQDDANESALTQPAGQDTKLLVTVAVSQSQAELLVHGSRTGTLTFALLGPDAAAVAGKGVNDRQLFEVAK